MLINKYQAFIFDMDGTMVDNMGVHMEVWLGFLAGLGVNITVQEFHQKAAGKKNDEILRALIGEHLTDQDILKLEDEKERRYREVYRPMMKPVAGLLPFLERSKQGAIPMAVATSAPLVNTDFVLDGTATRSYFQVVVSAEDVVNGKPHPEMYLTAAKRLGVLPEACLVFEDSRMGIQSAQRAGMDVVALLTTLTRDEVREIPGVLRAINNYGELVDPSLSDD